MENFKEVCNNGNKRRQKENLGLNEHKAYLCISFVQRCLMSLVCFSYTPTVQQLGSDSLEGLGAPCRAAETFTQAHV